MNSDLKRHVIVSQLSSGEFRSGEFLGEMLGVSRAAIAKHIKQLLELGLDIFSIQGKGYRLAEPIELYDQEKIRAYISNEMKLDLEVLNVIDSTNDFVKQKISSIQKGYICVAEAQTAGRGRHGRSWISPYGSSLYLSMYWSFDGGYHAVAGLSLAVGVAISNAINALGASNIKLKWPNDVYHDNKKLAGILIDVEGQMDGVCQCVIGVGLNVAVPSNVEGITQPWTDLNQILPAKTNKNLVAAAVISELYKVLALFDKSGLAPFIETWNRQDQFARQNVDVLLGDKRITGLNLGIDEQGALMLHVKKSNGSLETKKFYGGEVSVRANA